MEPYETPEGAERREAKRNRADRFEPLGRIIDRAAENPLVVTAGLIAGGGVLYLIETGIDQLLGM